MLQFTVCLSWLRPSSTPMIYWTALKPKICILAGKICHGNLSHPGPSCPLQASGRKRPFWANSNMSVLVVSPEDFLEDLFQVTAKHTKGSSGKEALTLVEWLLCAGHCWLLSKCSVDCWPLTWGLIGICTHIFHKHKKIYREKLDSFQNTCFLENHPRGFLLMYSTCIYILF